MAAPEGRAIYVNGSWQYEFFYTDHLGNTRVGFRANGNQLLKTSETAFDPFGVVLRGAGQVNATQNRFEFLNREKENTFNLNIIRLGARGYNPTIGRFDRVDPKPDVEGQESLSPYQYGWNNPVLRSDPNGDCPNCITGAIGAGIGALIGGGIEAGMQLYHEGKVSNWSAVGGAALQGGITGGATGFTGGASLLVTTSVSAGANVVGGAINNAVQGREITAKSVAIDAAVGVAAGVGGKVLDKIISPAKSYHPQALSKGYEIQMKGGKPDFSKHLVQLGKGEKNQVEIALTGNYAKDFKASTQAAGLSKQPANSTWHHVNYDTKTGKGVLQLVDRDAHKAAIPHIGGAAEYRHFHGTGYK
jgi:RHS repeat-associated protein